MGNNLREIAKSLRSYAKRCKDVKFTTGLLLTFLMTGALTLADTDADINNQRKVINNSISDMRTSFKQARAENNRLLKGSTLELIQLMEQGDQVVKSPWSSWQFGMNYFYSDFNGTYKGRGDKKAKYPYEGIFTRYAEGTEEQMYRYVTAALSPTAYQSIPKTSDPTMAASSSREGIESTYGLASTTVVPKAPVNIELNAAINPRDVGKASPTSLPQAPNVVLPAFEPRLVTPPVAPNAPVTPTLSVPSFSLQAGSDGNWGQTNADSSGNSNGVIESVVLTGGNFNITRGSNSRMTYSYDNYSGVAPWGKNASTDSGNTFTGGGATGTAWSGWSRTNATTSGSILGFQKLVGDGNGVGTMLSNSSNLLTNISTSVLREFVHLDHHNHQATATAITGLETGTRATTWDSSISSGSNETAVLTAYKDVRDNVNSTSSHGNTATSTSPIYAWLQSGRIVMEGSYNAVTNNYDHNGNADSKSAAINVGDILIQPHLDASGNYSEIKSAVFSLSPGNNYTRGHLSIMYNGSTGNIDLWTKESAIFLNSEREAKPISIVNRGIINMYGEKSAGIYNSNYSNMNLQFVSQDFVLDSTDTTNNTVSAGSYKPLNIYGDNSIGIYWNKGNSGSIEGNFAVNIGATGVGNQNFTTKANSTVTGGAETNGVAISNHSVNDSDTATTNKDYIRGSFGILSDGSMNLTSHKIGIYDKTEKNVGVMPNGNVLLNIGGGNITLEGGTTAKDNIGIYIDGKGAVTSTGDVKLDKGVGNLAIFAKGGSIPSGATNHVTVRNVEAKDTKNSVVIYAENGAKVKVQEMNVSGAGVESDASTTNGKDTGAVFATGSGTTVDISRAAVPTTDNISITGTKLTDATRYVGFGLMAANGATINATNNRIKVTDGSTGVASTGTGSAVNLTGGAVDYTGEGYALYVNNGGTIDMTNGTLTLRGKAVGFEKDLGGGTPAITTNGMTINVFSNDVTVVDLKNAPSLNLNGLATNLTGLVGISGINNTDAGGTTYSNYKLAVIDGLSAYNIDKNLDKAVAATGGVDNDADTFTKNLLVQRAKLNVLSGNNVTAHLDSAAVTALGDTSVVGLAMNSSSAAVSNNETQINIQSGATVSADRTDSGTGAVGLFINYGEANIANGGTVKVERHTANAANDSAVGVYAVNGSTVNNSGEISVGGNKSIGVLGLSYRKDSNGALVIDEFGTAAAGQGDVTVTNAAGSTITMDGQEAVGIYVENNDTGAHNVNATNAGTITMSGLKAVGMAGKNFNALTNSGTINITADQGVAMFGATDGIMTNTSTGTINLGDSTSESVLRIGMFTTDQDVDIVNAGTINAGKNSYGIYGKDVQLQGTSVLNIGNNGVGVFSTADTNSALGNIQIQSGATFNIGDDEAVGVFTENTPTGITIVDSGSNMSVGKNSYGYVFKGNNTKFTNTNTSTVTLKDSSVFLYSTSSNGDITNNAALTSTGNTTYGIYSAGKVVNNADINFNTGIGNVGIYHSGGTGAINNATITVGASDASTDRYAIGMAAGFNGKPGKSAFTGTITNHGTINVNGQSSIGMYGTGNGTEVYNGTASNPAGTINLNSDGAVGMYLDKNAKGYNYGTITTVGTPKGVVGISVKDNAEFVNHGTIIINSEGGLAAFNDGGRVDLVNYGTVTLLGGATLESSPSITPTDTSAGGVKIDSPNGPGSSPAVITKDGVEVPVVSVTTPKGQGTILSSGIGMYIDTLKGTNPINGLNTLSITEADLIIGSEAAEATNSKYIQVSGEILDPYIKTMKANPQISDWNIYPASLTWIATVTRDNNGAGDVENIYLAKVPYTKWAGTEATPVNSTDTYNFADGLEQRYGVEGIDSREKQLFNKLNSIGNNEEILLYQAFDEMMGHQYANVQQRTVEISGKLSKEIDHLMDDWRNPSKENNKVKLFGMRSEYRTDTAGVIDYDSNTYGVVYVHEDETIKLGNSTGWYAGYANNRNKFKDIGKSKETTNMVKLGVFKKKAFDDNGSLQWTISGEGYIAQNDMKRRYLVVDEIFGADSTYYTYGVSFKNELSKDFRLSERSHLKAYGSIDLGYGRFTDIKEDKGEVRLEVDSNDYYSIKPEVGLEFKYVQPFARKAQWTAGLGVAYETELGEVNDVNNKARVRYTSADWFGIRSEKENRKGNVKVDFNLGIDNQRVGFTLNAGYDTNGENFRGGIGFRAIY